MNKINKIKIQRLPTAYIYKEIYITHSSNNKQEIPFYFSFFFKIAKYL